MQKPPLSLGHEISGVVVAGDEPLMVGKEVIIPAVAPLQRLRHLQIPGGATVA